MFHRSPELCPQSFSWSDASTETKEPIVSNIFVDSLQRRIRAMNVLWDRAAHDMTLEQVNHHERSGILPIAFSISHAIRVQDRVIQQYFFGASPLWERGDWARRKPWRRRNV
jgi:hypothetical protein